VVSVASVVRRESGPGEEPAPAQDAAPAEAAESRAA
jgi:hypothetical protein